MRVQNYERPQSSFLSVEKDMGIIIDNILKNPRIQRLLYYTSADALSKPDLDDDQKLSLLEHNIKIVPKITVDNVEYNYLLINFNNFIESSNPEFRDNVIEFDIVCHLENWQLKDFQLRPFKIAAELDYMFNKKRLTGIGLLQFLSAQEKVLSDEYAAVCLKYIAYHGGEDKYHNVSPKHEEQLQKDFWNYRENKKE